MNFILAGISLITACIVLANEFFILSDGSWGLIHLLVMVVLTINTIVWVK